MRMVRSTPPFYAKSLLPCMQRSTLRNQDPFRALSTVSNCYKNEHRKWFTGRLGSFWSIEPWIFGSLHLHAVTEIACHCLGIPGCELEVRRFPNSGPTMENRHAWNANAYLAAILCPRNAPSQVFTYTTMCCIVHINGTGAKNLV